MPTYQMTLSDLKNWLDDLILLSNRLINKIDKFLLAQFFISFYEYCQVYCYVDKHNNLTNTASRFTVKVDILKELIGATDEDLARTVNLFMNLRHSLAHGSISSSTYLKIDKLLFGSDYKFIDILKLMNLDSALLNNILQLITKLSNYKTNNYIVSNCNDECIKSFNFQEDDWSGSTIGHVIKELRRDFDDTTILNTLESILGNAIYQKN